MVEALSSTAHEFPAPWHATLRELAPSPVASKSVHAERKERSSATSRLDEATRALVSGEHDVAANLLQHHLERPDACVVYVQALAGIDPARAELSCREAIGRHPLSADLHYLHAMLLSELDRRHEAADAARRSIYLDRTLAIAHFALGVNLRQLGEEEAARRAFRNARRICAALPPQQPAHLADGESAEDLLHACDLQLQSGGE
jgi:chemotaxis protein methyltransferase CheR